VVVIFGVFTVVPPPASVSLWADYSRKGRGDANPQPRPIRLRRLS